MGDEKAVGNSKVWAKRTKQQKQDSIKAMEEAAKKRTPEEQLRCLDQKYGVGLGATKERAKLLQRIECRKTKKEDDAKISKEVKISREDKEKKRLERIEKDRAKDEKLKAAEALPKDKLVEEVIKEEEEDGVEEESVKNKKVKRIMKKLQRGDH